MTRDDIIRMAREAKFIVVNTPPKTDVYWQNFEKFVDLVEAAEREECAKLVDELYHSPHTGKFIVEAVRARGQ